MKYRSILKALLITLVMMAFSGMAHAQVSLRFEPNEPTVGMSETTRVSVWLDEAIDIRTVQLHMAFDSSLLSSLEVGRGALFDAIPGGASFFQGYDANSAVGEWEGYTVTLGDGVYATGPGELMYWDVEGVTPGLAAITALDVVLADPDAAEISASFPATTIEVLPPIQDSALTAEPDFTPGTQNTLFWSDVSADEYQVQVSDDPGFGTVLDDSGWIGGISYTFTGLTDGQTYFYRVRARVATPAYETGWSAVVESSTQDDTLPTSSVGPLSPYQTSLTFDVPWTGSDATSGLDRVELWVDEGSGFVLSDTITDVGAAAPFSYTAPDEGSFSFYTIAYDGVDNAEAAPGVADATTTVDVTAPSGDLLINGGATLTNDPAVTLTNTVTGAATVRYMEEGGAWTDWEAYADTRAWTLAGTDGLLTVLAEFRDLAGNVYPTSAAITLDTEAPIDSFVINDDDLLTNSTLVTLTNAGSDAAEMRFTNDAGDWSATESAWRPYGSTYGWDIPSGEGPHTVYAEYRDLAGNVSSDNDDITLDTLPPAASFVINNDYDYALDTAVVLTSTSTDAAQMQFSNDGVSYSGWVPFEATYDWTLDSVQGLATVSAQYMDAAGNVLDATATITLDTIPPVASFVIDGDAEFTMDTSVELTSTATDAAQMQFSNDGLTYSGWVDYASPHPWTLGTTEGEVTVYAQYRDLAGNVTDATDLITYDITPPVASFVINNDDAMTNNPAVVLTNTATDAVSMQFSADGSTYSGWVDFAPTYDWTLVGGEGPNTVYGQFRDAAGNVTDTEDQIELDTLPPTATFVINNDDTYALNAAVVLTNTSTDAAQMQFSNDGTNYSGWVPYADTYDWTLDGTQGEVTVSAQYMDAAGNIVDATDTINLDTIPPVASFVIDGDATFTSDILVELTNTGTDVHQMQFSNDGTTYSGWVPFEATYDWTLDDIQGERTVYAQFRDEAGNVVDVTDTITLDSAAPAGTMVINGDAPFTTTTTVTLNNDVTDAVRMQFSNDGTSFSGWVAYAADPSWTLETTQGLVTVYGQFEDAAGNVFETSDTITLDTSPPEASFVINNDDDYALDTAVVLTSTSTDAAQMQFSNDGTSYSGWVPYADTYDWTLAAVDGLSTVYAQYRDAAGNIVDATDTITLDTDAPVASLEINDGDLLTNNPNVSLGLTVTGATEMQFSNDGTNYSGWVLVTSPVDWVLDGPDGDVTVYGQFRDAAGNVTLATDTINLDTTPPEGDFAVNGDAPVTGDTAVTLNLNVTGAATMEFSNNGTLWSDPVAYAATFGWDLVPGDGTKTVHARFTDVAGNQLTITDDIELDTTAPEGGLVINNDDTYATALAVTLNSSVTGATEMRFSADGTTFGNWETYADTFAWTLADVQGSQTVYGEYRDAVGNVIGDDDAIILDTEFPVAGLVINNDEALTNNPVVVLTNSTTGAVEMQFSNDGTNYSGFVPVEATIDWTLAGPDGLNTVYGQFRDEAGNVSTTQDDINLDATPPEGTFAINGGATVTNNPAVSLAMTVTGATEMEFSNDGTTWSGPVAYATTYAWDLTPGDGPKTVHARFFDAAGNELALSQDIALDTTASEVPILLAEPTFTQADANTLAWGDVGAASYYLEAATDAAFTADLQNSGWITLTEHTFTGLADGQIYFYRVKSQDELNNESAWSGSVFSTQDATVPDSEVAPLDTYQTALTFEVPWTGSDATSGLASVELFVNDGGGWDSAGTTTNVDPIAPFSFTAPGAGTYSFYTRATDVVGWIEDAPVDADATTTVDVAPPEGGFVVNNDDAYTTALNVTLNMSVTGAEEMQFSNDGATWSDPIAYAATLPWILEAPDGLKTVQGRFFDAAGNELETSDDIELDTTPPEGTMVVNGDAPVTNSTAVVLNSAVTGAVEMQFSNDGTTWIDPVAYADSFDWTLTSGDGTKTVSARYFDAAGLMLETSDAIELDTTAPDVPVLVAEPEFTTGTENELSWGDIGAASYYLEAATDAAFTAGVINSDWVTGTSFTFTGLDDGQMYYFRLKAQDELGNETDWSATVSSTQDATAPASEAGPLAEYSTDLNLSIPWSGSDATSGLASVELFVDDGNGWDSAGTTTEVDTPVAFSYTAPGEGTYSFYTRATDVAGLVEDAPADADAFTIIDITGPVASFVINDDAVSTNLPNVVLAVTATGANEMRFANNPADWDSPESDWEPLLASVAWNLEPGDGEKTVYGQFRDAAHNVTDAQDTIILDTTAPDVPALAGEPEFTLGLENTLSWVDIGANDYYLEMATDAAFSSVVANSDWVTGTTFTFAALTDGTEYFFRIKGRDSLGNESDWSAVESSTQDASPPVSSAGPLDPFQTSLTFDVPWSGSDATSGLQSVELFANDGNGWVSAGTSTEVTTPVAFSYTAAGEGTYSFYTRATDMVGLVEAIPADAQATTVVDASGPEGTMVVNNDEAATGDINVQLTLAVTGATEMQFSNNGADWSTPVAYADTYAWVLENVDGTQTVHGRFLDEAGHELLISDDIELDTTEPEGDMVINSDAAVTNSVNVTLNNAVTGATQMQFSNDGTTWSDLVDYADSYDWVLLAGDGTKTVQGRFVDGVGNEVVLSDEILLDTTAPEVPVITAEPAFTAGLSNTVGWNNTGGTAYLAEAATDAGFNNVIASTDWITNTFFEFTGLADGQTYYYRVMARDDLENESDWSGTVMSTQDATAPASVAGPLDAFQSTAEFQVPWTGNDVTSGLASVELFVNDGGGWASAGSTDQVDPPAPFTYTAGSEGTYSFYVVASDVAGNVEGASGVAESTTVVDLTAPVGTLAINGGDETTGDTAVVLNSAVTDLNGVVEMQFTNTEGDWPAEWAPYAETFDWTLPDGDGLHTVYARYRDGAGNILAINDAITLDTTPPGLPAFVAEPEFTPGSNNTLFWTDSGAASYFVQRSDDPGFGTIQANTGWLTALEFNFTGLSDGQIYYYRIKAQDDQGNETNWSDPVFSTQDATAPSSGALPMPTYQGTADIVVLWQGNDATSGLASVELFVSHTTEWESAGFATSVEPPEPFVYTAPEAGTYRFYTVATDVAGNVEIVVGTVDAYTTVDFSAPAAAADLDADPGLGSVSLAWTNPEINDLDKIEVWSKLWTVVPGVSAYPEYDDIAAEPVRPASRAEAEASDEWILLATLNNDVESFVHTEGMDSRGVFYYEVFLRDYAGNYSSPAAEGTRATNYRLGDLNNDDAINVFDITSLGATYGLDADMPGYNGLADIGPTDDGTGTGIPTTDDYIEFEDLTIMAMNYGLDKAAVKVEGSEAPALTWYQVDETSWVLGLMEPCSSLKALHLRAQVPESVSVTVESGAALADLEDFFLANIDRHGLDAGFAVLGQGAVLPVSGEILRVTTNVPVDLSTTVAIEVRDADNNQVQFALADEPILVLPKAYRLANNYPNPFNPTTTIAFDLPEAQKVRLVVYDLKGRLVKELVSEPMEAGSHSVIWNGTDRSNRKVASGVYFYQVQAGPLKDTKRMLLVK